MPADVEIDPSTPPWLDPETVSLQNPRDVIFSYLLTNVGDEDGTSTGWYMTLEDMHGTNYHSDYAPDATISPGQQVQQGITIPFSIINGLPAGDYWVSLRDDKGGNTAGAARLTVHSLENEQAEGESQE